MRPVTVDPNAKESWISGAYDRPSTLSTIYDNTLSGAAEFTSFALNGISTASGWIQKKLDLPYSPSQKFAQWRDDLNDFANTLSITTDNPRLPTWQKGIGVASNFIGGLIPQIPLFAAGGELFGLAGEGAIMLPGIGSSIARIGETSLQDFSTFLPDVKLGKIAKTAGAGFAVGSFGGIKEATAMGGLAAALHIAPYAIGNIWRKIFGKDVSGIAPDVPLPGEPIDSSTINSSAITPQEAEILKGYSENPNDPVLHDNIANYLFKEGENVDPLNKQVLINILSKDDIDNLTSAVTDQLLSAGGKEADTSLSDFIIKNSLDNFRDNNMDKLGGLEGYLKYMDNEIKKVPDNIDEINQKIEGSKVTKNDEEVNNLHNKLNENKTLSDADHLNLMELGKLSKKARLVLDKLNYLKAKDHQIALRSILNTYTQALKLNISKFAEPKNVIDYINNKREATLPKHTEERMPLESPVKVQMVSEKPKARISEEGVTEKVEPKVDEATQYLNDLKSQIQASGSKLNIADFTESKARFDQFRENGSVLKKLIDCVEGK